MARIRSNIGKPTSGNGNVPILKNLARLNIDQPAVLNDQIRGRSSGSDSNQICSAICPRRKFTLSHSHLLACSLTATVWGYLQSVKIFAISKHLCCRPQNIPRCRCGATIGVDPAKQCINRDAEHLLQTNLQIKAVSRSLPTCVEQVMRGGDWPIARNAMRVWH